MAVGMCYKWYAEEFTGFLVGTIGPLHHSAGYPACYLPSIQIYKALSWIWRPCTDGLWSRSLSVTSTKLHCWLCHVILPRHTSVTWPCCKAPCAIYPQTFRLSQSVSLYYVSCAYVWHCWCMYQDCWKATLGAVDCRRSEKRLHKGLLFQTHYRTIVEAVQTTSLFIEMTFFDSHFSYHTLRWLSVTVWCRIILCHHVKHSYSRSHCYSVSRVMNTITMSIYCHHFLIRLSCILLCLHAFTPLKM